MSFQHTKALLYTKKKSENQGGMLIHKYLLHRKKYHFLWSKSPFHWIEVVTRNKSRMSESISEDSLSNKNLPTKYKMYPIRWLVLLTIFLFNLSNNLLWISFSAVSTKGNIRLVFYEIHDIISTWYRMNIQQKIYSLWCKLGLLYFPNQLQNITAEVLMI